LIRVSGAAVTRRSAALGYLDATGKEKNMRRPEPQEPTAELRVHLSASDRRLTALRNRNQARRNSKTEQRTMWLSLFVIVTLSAVALSIAAVMVQSAGQGESVRG
jgi:hypothetical protein